MRRICRFFDRQKKLLRTQWAGNIERVDKRRARFVGRMFLHVIKGKIVEAPRDPPRPKGDAIPMVFLDAPKYFTRKALVKGVDRDFWNDASESTAQDELSDKTKYGPSVRKSPPTVHLLKQPCFSVESGTVYLYLCYLRGEGVTHTLLPKLITFKQASNAARTSVLFCVPEGQIAFEV